MVTLVKFIGIVIASIGIIFLLSPPLCLKYVAFWSKGKRLRAAGTINILICIILLLTASKCRKVATMITLGIIGLLKSISFFTIGQEQMNSLLRWWQKRSLLSLRFVALGAIIFGALILWAA